MATISEALQIAIEHHQAGRVDLAEEICRRILAVEPEHLPTLQLSGMIAYQDGRSAATVDYLGRAIAIDPSNAKNYNNLGIALQQQGKPDEAAAYYRQALQLQPDYAQAHNNLGNALHDLGEPAGAIACLRRALELDPSYAHAHNNLGSVWEDLGRLDDAISCYRRALELQPTYAEALNNLGTALQRQGRLEESIGCCRQALQLEPNRPEFHNNLGYALQAQGKPDEAAASYRMALQLKPDYADAHNNLGNVLNGLGKLGEAVVCYRRALELKPDVAGAYNNLGTALKDQGKLEEAVACYRRALELKTDFAETHSNLLCALQYRAGATLSELAAAHAEYDRRHAAPLRTTWRPHENLRDPHRRLRAGFVSPDLGRHPMGYFLIRGLENLDQGQFETVCYCDRILKDDLTARLQAATTIWRDVYGLRDEELADEILADRIDILFDLAGHTAKNRLLVFARKPAPIQVTWFGYVGTTGLKAMDYILADRHEIPPHSEAHYCERVLRMPDGYVCYDPPSDAPPVSPLPALKQGYVTFGSLNNSAKINRSVIELWAKLLHRLPRSRLVLKHKGMNDVSIAEGLLEEFASHGINPRRVECLGWSAQRALLAEYNRIDLALDTFPYSGCTTTCEALWMGVPVITCPGETFAGRHSLSHLSMVGFTETIARDLDEYVEIAVRLADDLPRLAEIRAGLRQQVAESPLCDGPRFAENLMKILREVWRRWCSQEPPRI